MDDTFTLTICLVQPQNDLEDSCLLANKATSKKNLKVVFVGLSRRIIALKINKMADRFFGNFL